MTAQANLDSTTLATWLRDLAQNPVDPDSLDVPQENPHADPETALALDSLGIPVWWPMRHPDYRNGAKLPMAERRTWCLAYLAGQLSPMQTTLRSADARSRRQMLAESLLRTHMALEPAELPTPDSL